MELLGISPFVLIGLITSSNLRSLVRMQCWRMSVAQCHVTLTGTLLRRVLPFQYGSQLGFFCLGYLFLRNIFIFGQLHMNAELP